MYLTKANRSLPALGRPSREIGSGRCSSDPPDTSQRIPELEVLQNSPRGDRIAEKQPKQADVICSSKSDGRASATTNTGN